MAALVVPKSNARAFYMRVSLFEVEPPVPRVCKYATCVASVPYARPFSSQTVDMPVRREQSVYKSTDIELHVEMIYNAACSNRDGARIRPFLRVFTLFVGLYIMYNF
jgi:hypothetical protein